MLVRYQAALRPDWWQIITKSDENNKGVEVLRYDKFQHEHLKLVLLPITCVSVYSLQVLNGRFECIVCSWLIRRIVVQKPRC